MQLNNKKLFPYLLVILFSFVLCQSSKAEYYLAQGIEPSIETQVGRDIIGVEDSTDELLRDKKVIIEENNGDSITFSARNISVKDAFATLARISGESISVGSDIRDEDKIAVIEIKEQPFEQAFFSLIDAAMVNYTQSGETYTVIKGGTQRQIMIFGLSSASVDKELPILERRADLSYDNQDLATLLKDLANKFGIDIVLTAVPTERVSARVRAVNVEQALNLVLSGTSFDFTKSGINDEAYVIYNRLNKNFTVGQTSRLFQLMNLEAKDVQALLPVQIRANVRISNDQNAIIADGSINDLSRLEEFLKEIDRPLPQVELEVKLIEISKRAMVDFMLFADTLTVGHPTGVAEFDTVGSTSGGSTIVKSLVPGSGLKLNFSTDRWKIFNDKITYLESMSLARVRAYPKLVSLSGRTAMINIDTDTNLVLGAVSSQSSGIAVAATQSLQRITAGTALSITPVVGTGGLISTMIQIEVSDNSGSTTQNGVTLPETTTRRRIAAEVQVRDGETVGIGGLIIDNDGITNRGLPLVANIPLIGRHMNNRERRREQSELIVLITPRIRNIPEDNTVIKTSKESNDVDAPVPKG